eukprot:8891087-Ditylum_brightwellii.AAC.1
MSHNESTSSLNGSTRNYDRFMEQQLDIHQLNKFIGPFLQQHHKDGSERLDEPSSRQKWRWKMHFHKFFKQKENC